MRPWAGAGKVQQRLDSAAALIRLAFNSPTATEEHRLRLIRDLLWDLTEADGKYRTRYRSEGTRRLGTTMHWQPLLQHEHVVPRKTLRDAILALPDKQSLELERLLASATGCVVTRDEHRLLTDLGDRAQRWERYRLAGIQVWDLAVQPPQLMTESPRSG